MDSIYLSGINMDLEKSSYIIQDQESIWIWKKSFSHSTSLALISLYDNNIPIIQALMLSKVFGTVDHAILISKLEHLIMEFEDCP